MKTLEIFTNGLKEIPASTAWYLSDLGEFKGKQERFAKQVPHKLENLKEHAIIESSISSNRIEGVTISQDRIDSVIGKKGKLRDRNEEEIRGYRKVLDIVHQRSDKLDISIDNIILLHKICRGEIWDAGKLKEQDSDIVEKYPDGRFRVRFKSVSAKDTEYALGKLVSLLGNPQIRDIHPLIALAAFNLDFLCIHPFRDGNGRVSRLLLLLQAYQAGYSVGRYISLERIIEENKERYYETLEESSQGWHEGEHDPWPYINFLLFVFKLAYTEYEQSLKMMEAPRGAKTSIIQEKVRNLNGEFMLTELETLCPSVSRDMIRKVLKDLKKEGKVECIGRGPNARWKVSR